MELNLHLITSAMHSVARAVCLQLNPVLERHGRDTELWFLENAPPILMDGLLLDPICRGISMAAGRRKIAVIGAEMLVQLVRSY